MESSRLDPLPRAANGPQADEPLVSDEGTESTDGLLVRGQFRLVDGEAGRAVAAAQGRALAALLASLAESEVGQGEEVAP